MLLPTWNGPELMRLSPASMPNGELGCRPSCGWPPNARVLLIGGVRTAPVIWVLMTVVGLLPGGRGRMRSTVGLPGPKFVAVCGVQPCAKDRLSKLVMLAMLGPVDRSRSLLGSE